MGGLRTSSRLCALMAIAIVGVVAAHDQPTPTRSTGIAGVFFGEGVYILERFA